MTYLLDTNTCIGVLTNRVASLAERCAYTRQASTLLAATNDVFFAPQEGGIPLFDANNAPTTGDVISQIYLWDAGTEGNEEPGIGPNTVTNQLAPTPVRRRRQSPTLERRHDRYL